MEKRWQGYNTVPVSMRGRSGVLKEEDWRAVLCLVGLVQDWHSISLGIDDSIVSIITEWPLYCRCK